MKDDPYIPPEEERFMGILHPYALRQYRAALQQGTRFVHYTSAEVAMNILRSKEVWMRNASCMNDFLEVKYGLDRLTNAYSQTNTGERFRVLLNQLFPGITTDIEKLFNGWAFHFQTNTYFACVSEHMDAEDSFGRLSMWRAYGETTGVALVLNNSVFFAPANDLNAFSSPVAYLDDQAFEKEFGTIVENIRAQKRLFGAHPREEVTNRIFRMLRFAALCTKHRGFAEEKEWRVIYTPPFDKSLYLTKDIHVIKGVPQVIYKIPLKDIPEAGFAGSIPTILDRIIIGPTEYPLALAEAFVQLLEEAGVSDPGSKVRVSDIPLRR